MQKGQSTTQLLRATYIRYTAQMPFITRFHLLHCHCQRSIRSAKLSHRDQDKYQEKHKKRNRKTIEGQISYSSSLLKGEGPHGSISLQTLPTGLSCNSSYVDSGMCWIPPWTNLTHLKQQESNLGRVFFLCWSKELDLFKEGSKQESESANRGDKTRQFKTERVSDVYFHFP